MERLEAEGRDRSKKPRRVRVFLVIENDLCPTCGEEPVRAMIRWTPSKFGPPSVRFHCSFDHRWYSKRQPTVEEIQEDEEDE